MMVRLVPLQVWKDEKEASTKVDELIIQGVE